jgi:hypothetical protein
LTEGKESKRDGEPTGLTSGGVFTSLAPTATVVARREKIGSGEEGMEK